jgi:hypothetical protein
MGRLWLDVGRTLVFARPPDAFAFAGEAIVTGSINGIVGVAELLCLSNETRSFLLCAEVSAWDCSPALQKLVM